jgi:long-subunit fatty acid transport protein
MTRRTSGTAAAAGFLALAAATGAHAGGLFVPGYGSQAQPRAGAFVAKADDPSALYYNPAGLAKQKGTSLHLGMNFIAFNQDFQRTGSYEAPEGQAEPAPWTGDPYPAVRNESTPAVGFGRFQGIPLFGLATDLGGASPLVFGIGLIADHGYPERKISGDYQFEDPDRPPPPQRYDIVEQDVSAAFPSLAVAYRVVPEVDVGVRVSWGFAGSKARQVLWGIRNYPEDVHRDGQFFVKVHDNFIPAAGVGLLYRPADSLEIGASYHTPKSLNFKGEGQSALGNELGLGPDAQDFIMPVNDDDVLCESGGTLTALKACVNLKLPQTASLGGRYIVRDSAGEERGDVELDVEWEDWSEASDVGVIVDGKSGLTGLRLQPAVVRHGFRDTFSFRLGGSYGFDVGDDRLEARAGAAYDTAAAPLSWTRLDVDGMARTTLGGGLAYALGSIRLEVGAGVVVEQDRTVAECNTSLDQLGCSSPDAQTPQAERESPDPVQPLTGANNQVESPFNAGTYSQSYVLLSAGATYAF